MNSSSRCRGVRWCSSQYFVIRHALDQVHDEVGPTGAARATVEHAGDVRMIHQGQCLPLRLEAGDDLPGVHTGLDGLQRDQALDRLGLPGHPNGAHAPFADLFQELVMANDRAWALGCGRFIDHRPRLFRQVEQVARLLVGTQERLDCGSQFPVLAASLIQIHRSLCGRLDLQGSQKDRFFRQRWLGHG